MNVTVICSLLGCWFHQRNALLTLHMEICSRFHNELCFRSSNQTSEFVMQGNVNLPTIQFPGVEFHWIHWSWTSMIGLERNLGVSQDVYMGTSRVMLQFSTKPNLVKSRSREIGCCNGRIALKFDRHLGSSAAEVPVIFQSDWKSLKPNLAASRLHEILR